MLKFLNYLKYMGIFILLIFLISSFLALLNYLGMNNKLISNLGIILNIITFLSLTFIASKKNKDKGYIIGLKLSLLFISIMIIFNLILFKDKFTFARLIYYIILITSSILGGVLGKNLKLKKKA